jgi:hypothetical protein
MIKKAYKLTVKELSNPWDYDDIIVYAETHGEAKSKGLSEFDGAETRDDSTYRKEWRDVVFTDIQARRIKRYDKTLFEGEWITQQDLEYKNWERARDEEARKLAENNPNGIAVVWVGCYGSYWGANRAGYFTNLEAAGKYSTKEAYEIVKGNDYSRQERVVLLDVVEYNLKIKSKIEELQKQLI